MYDSRMIIEEDFSLSDTCREDSLLIATEVEKRIDLISFLPSIR
jgi:hypothetical protein